MYQPLQIRAGGLLWEVTHAAVEGYRRVFGAHVNLVEAEEHLERLLAGARPTDG